MTKHFRNKYETFIWAVVLIGILTLSVGLYIYHYNECREFGHSILYCMTRK